MASAFLGNYASVTAVDLIQRKKLNFRNFYELTEARNDSLQFYSNNYGIPYSAFFPAECSCIYPIAILYFDTLEPVTYKYKHLSLSLSLYT